MSNVPITSLPPATTPLTGTEAIPLVQGASTKRASVADLANAVPLPNINAIVPDQAGQNGNVLTTDGATVSWQPSSGGGGASFEVVAGAAFGNGNLNGAGINVDSCVRQSQGRYLVTFTPGLFGDIPGGAVTPVVSSGTIGIYTARFNATPFGDAVILIYDPTGTLVDQPFTFLFIGPKAA